MLGTNTSGLDEGDEYVRARRTASAVTVAISAAGAGRSSLFASWLALDGPAYTISTACSSSTDDHQQPSPDRRPAGGRRHRRRGRGLSRMPVSGFNSTDPFSPPCEPFGRNRQDHHWQAAALMVLTREPGEITLGRGESAMRAIFPPHIHRAEAIRAHQALNERA
ncbi:MAG: beta-ketoacyl synthase N-terminal-like domain-containing protein [Enterobacter hormaechei]